MTTASVHDAPALGPARLRDRLEELNLSFPVADLPFVGPESPAAASFEVHGLRLANRIASLPSIGGDAGPDGEPTATTLRRWAEHGRGGASLLWSEAVAVSESGRAQPGQLLPHPDGLTALRKAAAEAREESWSSEKGWCIGLQLAHAGRWAIDSRGRPAPRPAMRHPYLDARSRTGESAQPLSDLELEGVGEDLIRAARIAWNAGFGFVDLHHGNGELLNELLAARTREGRYGGSLGARTRLLRRIIAGIRAEAPGLVIAVRLSLFDALPFESDPDNARRPGRPIPLAPSELPYLHGFGVDTEEPESCDSSEPFEVVTLLRSLGVRIIGSTGGSRHYCPHMNQPSATAGASAYPRPEEPLVGVARHLRATHALKIRYPDLLCVGAGYSYLGALLPYVAPAVVERQWTDMVGLGRLATEDPSAPRALVGEPSR